MAEFEISIGKSTAETICLYHGTDVASAGQIVRFGLSRKKAAVLNGYGDFWATQNLEQARWFAEGNPSCGEPAVLRFNLATGVFFGLLEHDPPMVAVEQSIGFEAYQFLPTSFEIMNSTMTNVEVLSIDV